MVQAVIFDLDGTLLDTLTDIHSVVADVLDMKGFSGKSIEQVRMAVGRGVTHLARCLLPEGTPERTVEETGQMISEVYEERGSVLTRPYDGVAEMLRILTNAGIPLAVLTNKPQPLAEEGINRYFPDTPFRLVRGVLPGLPIKPHPDSAAAVLAVLGSSPGETALVGDSDIDMRTASAAGLLAVGVSWGFRDRSLLLEHEALFVADHPREICEYVLKN